MMTDASDRSEAVSAPDTTADTAPQFAQHTPGKMRFTVIDTGGTISFVASVESLKPTIAACSHSPASLDELLQALALYDDLLAAQVRGGLAVFDEHVTADAPEGAHRLLAAPPAPPAVFRVIDDLTGEASRKAFGGGLVIFNIKARRIVQVHNNLLRVRRRDRGRVRQGGKPVDGELYGYELPAEWALVP